MSAWFDNPKQLFNENRLLDFWPSAKQSVDERVNSATRAILYIAIALYIIQKDPRVLILATVSIGVLYAFYKSDMIASPAVRPTNADGRVQPDFLRHSCEKPSLSNPMANVLMSDYSEHPDRPSACYYPKVQNQVKKYLDDTLPQQSIVPGFNYEKSAAHQWYTMPVSQIPGDQTAFAEACYGAQTGAQGCRDDPSSCSPNARGVQLEAFAGIDSSNQPRTGMLGR